jgi:putative heme-binding domain-containing protein
VKGTELSEEQFNFLHEQVADIRDASQRSLALTALHRTRLTPEQAAKVVDHLALTYLSPADAEIILLIAARHHTYEMGQNLLRGITNSAYMRSIPTDFLERTLKPFGPVVVKRAVEAHHIAKENAAASASKLEALDARLPEGDIRRGQAVFNSAKVNCASCHAIGYLGGKVGPDLTKIGAVRTRNDLLESILYPSASFVRSYEPYVVLTTDGTVESGILRNERPGEIVLVKDAKQTVRIPRDRVEDLRAGIVSIMPDGLQRQLSDQELADLLAFLQACK